MKKLQTFFVAMCVAGVVLGVGLASCRSTKEAEKTETVEPEKPASKPEQPKSAKVVPSKTVAPVVVQPAVPERANNLGIIGKRFGGTQCKAGKWDLPKGSSETLEFGSDGVVKLIGTGVGFSSSGTYTIDEEKKQVIMVFNQNGKGTLVGTYTGKECTSLDVSGDVSKAVLHIKLTGIFVRE
ncbi:MAG: hypothetical protein IJP62_09250 [Treponema sp.]|nr:hypothetical protein [Treponema sp.]